MGGLCVTHPARLQQNIIINGDKKMKLIQIIIALLITFSISSYTMAEEPMYAFSADGKNRPITGCLEIGNRSLSAIILSMNCKKSVVPNILLCSQERVVQYYTSSNECQKAHDSLVILNGK